MFKICTLCSSSKGNCSFITDGETNILIDCGIKLAGLKKFCKENNLDIQNIDAVIITHEYIDHICGLKSVCKCIKPKIYAHSYIQNAIDERLGLKLEYQDIDISGFMVGNIMVYPFRVSHDSIFPLGYTFVEGDKRVSYATDLGIVSSVVLENLYNSDMAFIEANHDKKMLLQGNYPMLLKRRVQGELGHLSNDESAKLISSLSENRLQKVLLCHLSENNNLPELAYSTVCSCIEKNKNITKHIEVEVAPSTAFSKFLEV